MQLATWQILCASFVAGVLMSLALKPRVLAYLASLAAAVLIACLPSCLQLSGTDLRDIDVFVLVSTIPASLLAAAFATYSAGFFFSRHSK
jgi:hypothetical protein